VKQDTAPRLMDIAAAGEYLGGISRWTIYALVGNGALRTVKLPSVKYQTRRGRRLLFDRADLDAFIEKCKREGA
jgi:hypothetical protein